MKINKKIKINIDDVPVKITLNDVDNTCPFKTDKMLFNLGLEATEYKEGDYMQEINEHETSSSPKVNQECDTVKVPVTESKDQPKPNVNQSLNSINSELETMEDPIKMWHKSRTIWVNVGVIIMAATTFLGFNIPIPDGFWEMVPVALGIINIILRKTTKEPIKFK